MNDLLAVLDPPDQWHVRRFGWLVDRVQEVGRPELQPLSVFLDQGVVPRSTRDDNYNRLGADLSKYLVVRPGDIVFNKLRTWQGGLGVSKFEGIVSPAYYVCRPRQGVEPRFLHYLLRSVTYLQELTRISKWMPPSQFDIGWDDLRVLPTLLPTPGTQRAIADFLDAETARIETLIAKKRKQATLLDDRWAALVTDHVCGRRFASAKRRASGIDWIGELPNGWGTPSVGMMFDVELGKMLNQRATEGRDQRPYLRNQNVQWDTFDLKDVATMHFGPDEHERFIVRRGDLLVCEGGDVGRAAMWSSDTNIHYQKALHRVRPRTSAPPRFLMYVLWAASSLGVFTIEGNQSTIVHLTREQLRAHRVPWPPEEQQRRIVADLDKARVKMREIQERLARQIALLAEHRQALITAAVTGQLKVPGVA